MPEKQVKFEGTIHTFPDDFTDADIQQALAGYSPPPPVPEHPGPAKRPLPPGLSTAAAPQQKSWWEQGAENVLKGARAGAYHTAINLGNMDTWMQDYVQRQIASRSPRYRQWLEAEQKKREAAPGTSRWDQLQRKAVGGPAFSQDPELQRLATPPPGLAGQAGYAGEQIGEFLVPIPGVSQIRAAKTAPWILRAGTGMAREGLDVGLKTLAQTGDPKEAKRAAVMAGPVGGVVEAGVPYLGTQLNRWAQSQYGKVLHPLGRKAKEVAEEQIPRIVEEGYGAAAAATKHGLAEKFNAKVADLGPKIGQEYAKLDQTTRTQLDPIYRDLADWMDREVFTKGGALKDPQLGEKALETWDYLQNAFGQYARTAKPSEVWEIRQALDKYVYRNKLTADESVAAANQVKKAVGNIIRGQLNSQHPSIAALNDQFHMWAAAAELINRNITNDIGKLHFARNTGIIGRFLMGATLGGGADVAGRHGEFNPWETATAAALGGLAIESTGWRTVSAVTKAKVADLLMSGKGSAAANLAARAVGLARTAGYRPPPSSSVSSDGGGSGRGAVPMVQRGGAGQAFLPARGATLIPRLAQAIQEHEGWSAGSVSQRNNNPGNIKPLPGQTLPGMIRRDAQGFAVFKDYNSGWNALVAQVQRNVDRGLNLNQFFAGKPGEYPGYAPAGDRNQPYAYAATVGSRLGIDPRAPLSSLR